MKNQYHYVMTCLDTGKIVGVFPARKYANMERKFAGIKYGYDNLKISRREGNAMQAACALNHERLSTS